MAEVVVVGLVLGVLGAWGPPRSTTTVVATAAATVTRLMAIHLPLGLAPAGTLGLAGVVSTGSGVPSGDTPSGTMPSGDTTDLEERLRCGRLGSGS